MKLLTGTSGFSYDAWKGAFYPEDLAKGDYLGYYASKLRACEINNTFYRMPKASVLEGWADQTPDSFRFVLKASRQITHFKRLKLEKEVDESLDYFLSQARALGPRLGPVLLQLPPNFKADVPRLQAFLDLIPGDVRAAFEFRHDSWHDDAVFNALRDAGAALCIAETEEAATPLVATAGFGYLRLRKEAYQDGELETWAETLREQPWDEAYVFFKHEDAGTGPRLAEEFVETVEG